MDACLNTADLTALVSALAVLVGAIAGVIFQLRAMRADIVKSVSKHKDETIAAIKGANPQ